MNGDRWIIGVILTQQQVSDLISSNTEYFVNGLCSAKITFAREGGRENSF